MSTTLGLARLPRSEHPVPGRSRPDPDGTGTSSRVRRAALPAMMGAVPIRVLLADDHPVVRRGLAALLGTLDDFEVVGEAEDGEAAVREAQLTKPDVVLMDVRMPGIDGVEATRRIRKAVPDTAVLVLTMYDEDATVFTAMQAGARGYLLKGAEQDEIADAIRAVVARPGDLRCRHRVPDARALRQPAGAGGVRRPVPGAVAAREGDPRAAGARSAYRPRSPRRCTSPPRRSATTSPRSSPSSRSATGPPR